MDQEIPQKNEKDSYFDLQEKGDCILLLKCAYCKKTLDSTKNDSSRDYSNRWGMSINRNDNICFYCGQYLSKCAVCNFPITIHNNSNIKRVSSVISLEGNEESRNNSDKNNPIDLYAFCTKCRHGGHFDHYRDWFAEFNQCPFSTCECRCKDS